MTELRKWFLKDPRVIQWHGERQRLVEHHDEIRMQFSKYVSGIQEFNCCFGILLEEPSNLLVSLIFWIVKHGHAFACLSNEIPSAEALQDLQFLITDKDIPQSSGITFTNVWSEPPLICYKIQGNQTRLRTSELLYIVHSSGSTGIPKIIHVPVKCITSNILRLGEIFQLTEDDVILNCSPPTFDPFVVDAFLVAKTGASLIILDRFSVDFPKAFNRLFQKGAFGVTFLQITPSIFGTLSKDQMEFVFSAESSLRIISFGGEPFPEALLSSLQIDPSKEIFNIYGISEISCWASIRKWEKGRIMDLGDPIDDEVFEVRSSTGDVVDVGELWIGSGTRKCLLDGEIGYETGVQFRQTGDFVERIGGLLYYRGRLGDVVKRFGVKINLLSMEESVRSWRKSEVEKVSCVFDRETAKIVLFYTAKENIDRDLAVHFQSSGSIAPDDIVYVSTFPMSNHGKISKRGLLESYRSKAENRKLSLKDLLRDFDWNRSFTANGGTSMRALQILNELSNQNQYPNLIELLLNPEVTIESLFNLVIKEPLKNPIQNDSQFSSEPLELKWKQDMRKCVDASPAIALHETLGPLVAVGSHSHILLVVQISSGDVISKFTLSDRIESKAVFDGDSLYIGCYDGFLYKLNFRTESSDWTFNSQGMIKSEVILHPELKLAIFGNYADHPKDNLFALNVNTGQRIWSRRVGSKGILSRALILENTKLAISSLDGTLLIVNVKDGEYLYSFTVNNPIFTNPVSIDKFLIISEVTGIIHCFNDNLIPQWSLSTGGNIFSSFEIRQVPGSDKEWDLFFGCYDNFLYCLHLVREDSDSDLLKTFRWKSNIGCPVYGKPLIHKTHIICCTTKGSILGLDIETGHLSWKRDTLGEIFSSPIIHEDSLIVGSRDNFLYCWKIKK